MTQRALSSGHMFKNSKMSLCTGKTVKTLSLTDLEFLRLRSFEKSAQSTLSVDWI